MAKDSIRLTTPVGVAKYPRLQTADTKFYELGEYKVDLVVPSKDAKTFVDKVRKLHKQAAAAGKAKVEESWLKQEVDDQGNSTGNVIIRCKVKNRLTKRGDVWDRKPVVVDKFGNRIVDKIVSGGSVMQLAVDLFFNVANGKSYCGLQPVGVKVNKLVEYTSDGAALGGFEFEESDDDVEADEEAAVGTTEEDEDLF